MTYKIQNRSPDNKRIKLIKRSDGRVTFVGNPIPTYQENTIQAGWCMAAITPVPELIDPQTTFELTAAPMGVDGRVSIYRNGTLVSSMRYNDLNSNAAKVKWFNDFFGAVVLMAIIKGITVFTIREDDSVVTLVFEDDDIDYIENNFGAAAPNRTAFFREQYRLAVGLKLTEIDCTGAAPVFEAKTSFEANVIEVSVDGGPWTDIYSAEGIYVAFMPGNPGADIRFNMDGSEPKRVRVRTSRDIGLYVNPLSGFDQINTNKAYTLYDRNGVMIDPFDPNNHDYSGAEFDDTTTTDDYAVFFAEAEFCLALEPEETYPVPIQSNGLAGMTSADRNLYVVSLEPISLWVNDIAVETESTESPYQYTSPSTGEARYVQLSSADNVSPLPEVQFRSGLETLEEWGTLGLDVVSLGPDILTVPDHIPETLTNLSRMFANSTKFNDPNVALWDVSNVTNMGLMFNGCTAFNQSLNTWDVSNVTNMGYMFRGCTTFNQPLNSWNTSKVTNMSYMFLDCKTFSQDLSLWCVPLILSKPLQFNMGATGLTAAKLPVWGTCP